MAEPADAVPGDQRPAVAIACQGGGSHTAFTAGVLSGLFADDAMARTRVVGLSGTSGGAVCALVAWAALRKGTPETVGPALEAFWRDNAAKGVLGRFMNASMLLAGSAQGVGLMPGISPYFNPMSSIGLDQFRKLLERHVDFSRLTADQAGRHPMLLLGAVEVQSGRFRAFNSRREAITPECVLASAAIPSLFRAVHVGAGTYWDGLFSQNPPVQDLLYASPDELWVIKVNPQERPDEPRTTVAINDRRNELSGNLSLAQELAFIETIDRLLEDGSLKSDRYKQVVVRLIELPRRALSRWSGGVSKMNRDVAFLEGLMAAGRQQASVFLAARAFEQALADRDAARLLACFAPDARIVLDGPFTAIDTGDGAGGLSRFVSERLGPSVAIDPVQKHIVDDDVVWSVRVRTKGAVVEGRARVTWAGGRITRFHLGAPAPSDR